MYLEDYLETHVTGKSKTALPKFEYIASDGTVKTTTSKISLFEDDYFKVTRSTNHSKKTEVYHEGNGIITCYDSLYKEAPIRSVKISNNCSILTTDKNVVFKDHSGAGGGGEAKVYKAPAGEAFGLELEICFPDNGHFSGIVKKLNYTRWVADNFPEWTCERDGSLEKSCDASKNGAVKYRDHCLELVSPPLSLQQHETALPAILEQAVKMGGDGEVGDWFGIHITSNIHGRHPKKSATKFLRTINDKKNRKFFSLSSLRHNSKPLNQYAPFVNLPIEDEGLVELLAGSPHYMAAFPRNTKGTAIEVRIFQSKLDFKYVMALLELVKHLTDYSLTGSDVDWISYVTDKASDNLTNYLIFCTALNDNED